VDDPWLWASVVIGLIVGGMECFILRCGLLARKVVRERFGPEKSTVSRSLEQGVALIFGVAGLGCLASYELFLRSYFSIPPPGEYTIAYFAACLAGIAAGYFPLLREFG
jgi:hypothetical protein